MASDSTDTQFDKSMRALKNRRWLALVLLCSAVVIAVGQVTGAVEEIIGFIEKRVFSQPNILVPETQKGIQQQQSMEQHRDLVEAPQADVALQSEIKQSPSAPSKAAESTPPPVAKKTKVSQLSDPETAVQHKPVLPEELQNASKVSNPLEQVREMEVLFDNIANLSSQILETLKTGSREGRELLYHFKDFAEVAGEANKEFRLVAGRRPHAGLRLSMAGRRIGDTSHLELQIDDLANRADVIDSMISSSSPDIQKMWGEVRSDIGKLRVYF